MDRVNILKTAGEALRKYKYVILVLALGIFLMSLPQEQDSREVPAVVTEEKEAPSMEASLEDILSLIEGVGKVSVMLTEHSGSEMIYQTDSDIQGSESGNSQRTETVIISDAQRSETGLVRQENPPTYRGAIVVCQGADDPGIQLAIVTSVSNVTGISADRITVLKMK